MNKKLAIIGGRDFHSYELLCSTINTKFCLYNCQTDNLIFEFDTIISGGASGADSLGARFAKDFNFKLIEYKAEWYNLDLTPCSIGTDKNGKKYNKLAGFNRNKLIINNADIVLAFWDGKSKGTGHSLSLAKQAKKNTLIVYY